MSKITTTDIPPRELLLICRKCARKLDGGFGPKRKQTLGRLLKDALRAGGRRGELRVIETACLGLCPNNAVTLLRANRPGRLLAIPAGSDATAVLAALDLPPQTAMLRPQTG
jgi:predicted metal-binding protein